MNLFKLKDFFKPTWKKVYWLFLVFLVAEVYTELIINLVPFLAIANIVSFTLKPASMVILQTSGIETQIALPVAKSIDLIWMYLLATILAKEVSKDKE
ncbi:MAG: hypothetical protein PHF68_03510 [Candidatus ainarchaeum sp.]|nr:hypothetical protein [Candidatus ainarchaeum sp.]